MIKVKFYHSSNNAPLGFMISGHADFAEYGSDIVCSAVSSAAYMAANTIIEILKVQCETEISEGNMKIIVPKVSAEETKTILLGLELHLNELAEQYPKNVTITTTEV